jgi:hypothetical protein
LKLHPHGKHFQDREELMYGIQQFNSSFESESWFGNMYQDWENDTGNVMPTMENTLKKGKHYVHEVDE